MSKLERVERGWYKLGNYFIIRDGQARFPWRVSLNNELLGREKTLAAAARWVREGLQ